MNCPNCNKLMHSFNDWPEPTISYQCFCGYEITQPMPPCSVDGCAEPGSSHVLDDEEYFFCAEHAAENGFCVLCGHFVAGGDDRYLHRTGLCDDCYRMKRDEERAEYEEEW